MVSMTGGCLCGAVRYECSEEPVLRVNCHCRDCQRSSGGPYVSALIVYADAVRISGELTYYAVKGESGEKLRRGFCPICGSRMFGKPDLRPDLMAIMASSLDDPSTHRPTKDIFTTHALPWDHMDPTLAKMAGGPDLVSLPRKS